MHDKENGGVENSARWGSRGKVRAGKVLGFTSAAQRVVKTVIIVARPVASRDQYDVWAVTDRYSQHLGRQGGPKGLRGLFGEIKYHNFTEMQVL